MLASLLPGCCNNIGGGQPLSNGGFAHHGSDGVDGEAPPDVFAAGQGGELGGGEAVKEGGEGAKGHHHGAGKEP